MRDETRAVLRELEEKTGQGTQEILARALDQFRRSVVIADTNVAYAALSRTERSEEEAALEEWDATLLDGLDDEA